MKITLSIIFFFFASLLQAQERSFTIKGELPNSSYNNRYIYLLEKDPLYQLPDVVLDSVLIQRNRFIFKGKSDRFPRVLHLVLKESRADDLFHVGDFPFILEPGMLRVHYDTWGVSVNGGKFNNEYNQLILVDKREIQRKNKEIVRERDQLGKIREITQEEQASFSKRIQTLYDQHIPTHLQFVRNNISNPIGCFFFFNYPPDRYPTSERAELYGMLPLALRERYEERENKRRQQQDYFQQSRKITEVGHSYREISGRDTTGNPLSLSAYAGKGKVVLIDIWASWCVPCVQEFEHLKEIYAKYKDRGLEIIGVSMDAKATAWKNAVKQHALPWPQLSDLQAWEGPVSKDYGIFAIPFTILLDENGIIVGRNLHAFRLDEKLEELFLKK